MIPNDHVVHFPPEAGHAAELAELREELALLRGQLAQLTAASGAAGA